MLNLGSKNICNSVPSICTWSGVIYISNISICLVRLAITAKNGVEFLRSCGDGDFESVTRLLANDPSLIKAEGVEYPSKL